MSDWPETSESLIQRVKDPGDDVAWTRLSSLYRPVVYRLACRSGLPHETAEDLVQVVFLGVAKSVKNWEFSSDGPRFRNWLGRVTKNAIINAATRTKPDQAVGTSSVFELLNSLPTDENFNESLFEDARLEAIRYAAKLIRRDFSDQTWAIFQATTLQGRSANEVAEEFGCSVGAVYASKCRVTSKLREKVLEISELWSEG